MSIVRAVFIAFVLVGSANSPVLLAQVDNSTAPPASSAFLVDRYFSPASGAASLHAAQDLVPRLEERFVPNRVGREASRLSRVAGILYRAAKFTGLDIPQDHIAMVVAHEVFGHGARLRELGEGRISYGFDTPIPYGDGSAVTRFDGEFPDSPLALLAVDVAGLEAQNVLADEVLRRASLLGRLNYREAWLYFESRITSLSYIQGTSPHSSEGHDIANFAEAFEEACFAPTCEPVTVEDLKDQSWLILGDPMLFNAIYAFAGAYVGSGDSRAALWSIPIGFGRQGIPLAGFQMTPYGTERLARVFVTGSTARSTADRWRPRLAELGIRFGTTGASAPWGVSMRVRDAVSVRRLRFDARVEFWRQPPIDGDVTFAPLETGAGFLFSTELPLPERLRSSWSRALHMTAGYKTAGFIPGEQLGAGFLWRVGLTVSP